MITRAFVLLHKDCPPLAPERLQSRLGLCSPGELVQRAVLIRQFAAPTDEQLAEACEVVQTLLTEDALRQSSLIHPHSILLLFLVKMEHIESLHWAHEWAKQLVPYLHRQLQPLPLDLLFHSLLIATLYERLPNYAHHYAWLLEVASARSVDQIYLLTPTNREPQFNPGGLEQLRPEEQVDLLAEVVATLVTTDTLDHLEQVTMRVVSPPLLCSAGAASIVFPADALIQQRSSQFGAELLSLYCEDAGAVSEQLVEAFVANNQLGHEAVCRRLMQTGQAGETVINRLNFPPIIFERVPLDELPERIASYGDYLARERVRELLLRIDENRRHLVEQASGRLREQTDALVAHPSYLSPRAALEFLRRLWYRVGEERRTALMRCSAEALEQEYRPYLEQAAEVELPSEQECHDRLVDALRNRPTWFAVLGRYGLLGLLIAYGVEVLAQRFGAALLPDVLRLPWLWFTVVWGLFLLMGVLTVLQAYRLILRRAVDYQNAVLRRLRQIVYQHLSGSIDEFYANLLDGIGDPEMQTAPPGSERRLVQDWMAQVAQLAQHMARAPLNFRGNLFCMPVSDFTTLPPMPYKQQENVDKQAELRQCAERGIFGSWRQIASSSEVNGDQLHTLRQEIENYLREGFEYIRSRYSVLQLLTGGADIGWVGQQIRDRLLTRSFFFLPTNAPLPHNPVQVVVYAAEDQSYADQIFSGDTPHLRDHDRARVTCCQLMWGLTPSHTPFLQRWRDDYNQHPNKAELHTLPDWQTLPDPFSQAAATANQSNQSPDEPIL